MRPNIRVPHLLSRVATFCGLALLLFPSASFGQICDPPGPPPRFGCQWSTDLCDWICAICDPFGVAPRTSCHWDGNVCNWICPGYTGVQVTVETQQPPARDASVYVRLSSLCTATGAAGFCNGSFLVYPGMPVSAKCQAIADTIANNCSAAGYAVEENNCRLAASLTASHPGCPATEFALGLSNDPSIFDQTGQGPLPDGESDSITGTTSSCTPVPGAVGNLIMQTPDGGQDVRLTWDDTTNADDYLIFSDTSPRGAFSNVVGTATTGATGMTLAPPPGSEFFLVAGNNSTCGLGSKY